jgi:hypothetical protein
MKFTQFLLIDSFDPVKAEAAKAEAEAEATLNAANAGPDAVEDKE